MTDQELVRRAREGDLAAFRTIVDQNKLAVFRLAYDLTGNRHDAEDISQEVFVKAYRSLDRFRGEAKLSSWLYRITVNASHDHRSRKTWSTMRPDGQLEESDETPMFHGHPGDNPEAAAEGNVIQGHIEAALERLTPRERTIFTLRHYQDLSLREIAGILKISEGTVKSMLFRALKRLQKELQFYRKDLGVQRT